MSNDVILWLVCVHESRPIFQLALSPKSFLSFLLFSPYNSLCSFVVAHLFLLSTAFPLKAPLFPKGQAFAFARGLSGSRIPRGPP